MPTYKSRRSGVDLRMMFPPAETAAKADLREALEHAKTRFECLAEDFEKAGDNVQWAMCSVDAERMGRALAALPSDQ